MMVIILLKMRIVIMMVVNNNENNGNGHSDFSYHITNSIITLRIFMKGFRSCFVIQHLSFVF